MNKMNGAMKLRAYFHILLPKIIFVNELHTKGFETARGGRLYTIRKHPLTLIKSKGFTSTSIHSVSLYLLPNVGYIFFLFEVYNILIYNSRGEYAQFWHEFLRLKMTKNHFAKSIQ
jgi:hypothetical protein